MFVRLYLHSLYAWIGAESFKFLHSTLTAIIVAVPAGPVKYEPPQVRVQSTIVLSRCLEFHVLIHVGKNVHKVLLQVQKYSC